MQIPPGPLKAVQKWAAFFLNNPKIFAGFKIIFYLCSIKKEKIMLYNPTFFTLMPEWCEKLRNLGFDEYCDVCYANVVDVVIVFVTNPEEILIEIELSLKSP